LLDTQRLSYWAKMLLDRGGFKPQIRRDTADAS
jgi:hypothetical protein